MEGVIGNSNHAIISLIDSATKAIVKPIISATDTQAIALYDRELVHSCSSFGLFTRRVIKMSTKGSNAPLITWDRRIILINGKLGIRMTAALTAIRPVNSQ